MGVTLRRQLENAQHALADAKHRHLPTRKLRRKVEMLKTRQVAAGKREAGRIA